MCFGLFFGGGAVLEVSQMDPLFQSRKKNNGQLCTKTQVNRFQWAKVNIGLQLAAQTYPTGIKQEAFKA